MKNVTKDVLKTIENEKIVPTPKWKFQISELGKMFLFCTNLVIGSVATSIVIFLFNNNEALFDTSFVRSFGEWVIISIPLVWIGLTSLILILSHFFFRNTKNSYKYEFWKIALINIIASLTIGSLIYFLGYTERLNQYFNDNVPAYSRYMDTRVQVWSRPELGYLAGNITKIEKDIVIVDFDKKEWNVDISESNIKGRVSITVGEKIKIVGKQTGKNTFKSEEIRPWAGRGNRMQ